MRELIDLESLRTSAEPTQTFIHPLDGRSVSLHTWKRSTDHKRAHHSKLLRRMSVKIFALTAQTLCTDGDVVGALAYQPSDASISKDG